MTPPRGLGLFAKRPVAGQVKTRLAASTSPEWAAQVARAFLLDLLDRLADFDGRRVLAFAPASERAYFTDVAAGRFDLEPQADGDLGRRMAAFFASQLALGTREIVLLGTDSPTIPLEYIEQAFRELARADVVLGPAADGGYYLIGVAHSVPPLFENVAWGGPQVLEQTAERVAAARLRLALLPPWYDVDTSTDWQMLRGHLAALRLAGVDPNLPRIEALFHS